MQIIKNGVVINYQKTDIGLDQVDNTSDVNKPVSTAQQTALNLKVDKVTGFGLSSNDYTTVEKTKLASVPTTFPYLPLAGGTVTGDITLNYNQIIKPKLNAYSETTVAITGTTGAITLDCSQGNIFKFSNNLTGNVTITFSNVPATGLQSVVLDIPMGTTAYSVAFSATTKIDTTVTTVASKLNRFALDTAGGTTWYGSFRTY